MTRFEAPRQSLLRRPAGRRTVVKSLFVAGYAASAGIAAAQRDVENEAGLRIEEIRPIMRDGYALPAYVARPDDKRERPALLVIHETFGIHEYIKDVCRRLAHLGYVAIAPDYYDRAGDAAIMSDWDSIRPIVAATSSAQVVSDTSSFIDWLTAQPYVGSRGIGTVGFCWGGAMVWLACAAEPRLRTGIAWYGLLDVPSYGKPPSPIDVAPSIRRPVLGLYGDSDTLIPSASVQRMRNALPASGAGAGSEIVIMKDAGHGFHADYRSTYRPVAAQAGWALMLSWLSTHGLKAEKPTQ